MKEFLAQIGAFIAAQKPIIETFFVGLAGALIDTLISIMRNNQTWDWDTVKVALIAAALNYATSKSRREAFKKAVATDPDNEASVNQ